MFASNFFGNRYFNLFYWMNVGAAPAPFNAGWTVNTTMQPWSERRQ